jgi:diaminohydroxyphosphoribosylaminopyrimidine deaminase/5-amino-6-(5-phosphoribosylamino)uracil reductase
VPNKKSNNSHEKFMQIALRMARRQAGQTHPNPNVGAVIVKDGQILAVGATETGGRPHAETIAIENAGELARGASLYVTLEPCSHHGKTAPCAEAIIKAGISKVIISCRDKNPVVSGNGVAMLKAAGVEVIEGVCEAEALEVTCGFFSVIEKKRPFISLKIATSLDGKIAYPPACHPALVAGSGEKPTDEICNSRPRNKCGVTKWLTGEPARNYGQLLRAQHDAILTGSGTVLADNPQLTCRLNGLENRSPIRIVLDRSGQIKDAHGFWVMSHKSLEENIKEITEKGITSLMIEAGAKLSTAFLESGLVDRVYWFRAPIIVGEGGLSAVGVCEKLAKFKRIEHITLGNDILEVLQCSQA